MADVWQYSFSQVGLTADPDIEYAFSFQAWADDIRPFQVDFEDTEANGYNRYGASSDPIATDGRSEWIFDMTDERTRYTFDVTFDEMVETTVQFVTFQLGTSDVVTYLDSLSLASVDDIAKLTGVTAGVVTVVADAKDDSEVTGMMDVTVGGAVGISQNSGFKSLKVYPNPAVDELYIELPVGENTVSIYNSIGMKMDEVLVGGSEYVFDISSYASGIYFVRTEQSVARFVK